RGLPLLGAALDGTRDHMGIGNSLNAATVRRDELFWIGLFGTQYQAQYEWALPELRPDRSPQGCRVQKAGGPESRNSPTDAGGASGIEVYSYWSVVPIGGRHFRRSPLLGLSVGVMPSW